MRQHLKKIVFLLSLLISTSVLSQAKGKEYGVLQKGKPLEISHRRNSDNSIDFLYKKSAPGSFTVYYNFNNVRNTNFSDGLKKVIVKHDSGTLFKLRPNDNKKRISYKSSYKIQKGIINPKINKNITYLLPIAKKEVFKVRSLSLKGDYFKKPDTLKYYKFAKFSPQVYSMRKGIVVSVNNQENNNVGKLTIEHEDGTYATYKGFAFNSFAVKLKQKVNPGEILGSLKKLKDKKTYLLGVNISYRIKENGEYGKTYIEPHFLTTEGVLTLEMDKSYTSDINDDVFFKEFSKREKKKYLKNK